MRKTIYIFLSLCLLFILVSCGDIVEEKSYTINFVTNTTTEIESITIKHKQTIELPTVEKEGYTFDGWYPNDKFVEGTEVTSDTEIGKSITLYAKWNATPITITFDLDGGHFKDTTKSTSINILTSDEVRLERAYKDGYLFMGWTVDGNEAIDGASYIRNTTIKANYLSMSGLESSYDISLELNGGHMYEFQYQDDEFYWMNIDSFIGLLRQDISADFHEQYIYSNFFSISEDRLIGFDSFFGKSDYYNKWRWLLMYIYYVASDEYKPYIYELVVNNYDEEPSKYGIEQIVIRNEIAGLLRTRSISSKVDDITYTSYDYGKLYDSKEMEEFFNIKSYETGVGTALPIPIRDGYSFMGWFDNPDFNGEAIFEIPYNAYGDKQYYAKWQK